MGAGRTEFMMSVFGRSYGRDAHGTVTLHGREIDTRTVRGAIDAGLAYVSEDRKVYGLNLITDIRTNTSSVAIGKLANKASFVNENEEIRVSEDYRKRLNIKTPTVMQTVGNLSGGNQQKVVLSKWLYSDPEVLILDEPTRGIDVGAKYEIYEIIGALAAEGRAIILISSELPELLGTCDRIYTLAYGRITGEVPIQDANQETLMNLMTIENPSKEVAA